MLFEPYQKILFIGDSITDSGRLGPAAPYGNGYVNMVHALLMARYPQLHLQFVNRGIAGNTVRDLASRWQRDVIAEQPDWLAVMIGINDVWRAFGLNPHEAVPLPEYETTLRDLLDHAHAQGARLILLQPYVIEPDRQDPMRHQMDQHGEVVKQLASAFGAPLVQTQAAFDQALMHTSPNDWANDRVHPNAAGHAIIALAFLRVVGFLEI